MTDDIKYPETERFDNYRNIVMARDAKSKGNHWVVDYGKDRKDLRYLNTFHKSYIEAKLHFDDPETKRHADTPDAEMYPGPEMHADILNIGQYISQLEDRQKEINRKCETSSWGGSGILGD